MRLIQFRIILITLLAMTGFSLSTLAADEDYFPAGYEDSKAKFLKQVEAFKVDLQANEPGQAGQVEQGQFQAESDVESDDLTVDYIYVPPKTSSKRLFILVSGVHGPESYGGSAIQQMFFDEVLPDWNKQLDGIAGGQSQKRRILDDTGLLVIHAFNPWGFKYGRRQTKNNIDLNRNFFESNPNPDVRNFHYEKMVDTLAKKRPVRCFPGVHRPFVSTVARGEALAKFKGMEALGFKTGNGEELDVERATAQGQYLDPKGLAFGGQAPEPQVVALRGLLNKIFKDYPEDAEVHAFDLHTGLGEKDQLHMIVSETANSGTRAFFDALYKEVHDNETLVLTDPQIESGFYDTSHDFNEFIEDVAKEHGIKKAASITVEFGTKGTGIIGQLDTAFALTWENQGYHHGYYPVGSSEEQDLTCKANMEAELLDLFYPQESETWKPSVIRKARAAIGGMEAYLLGNKASVRYSVQ